MNLDDFTKYINELDTRLLLPTLKDIHSQYKTGIISDDGYKIAYHLIIYAYDVKLNYIINRLGNRYLIDEYISTMFEMYLLTRNIDLLIMVGNKAHLWRYLARFDTQLKISNEEYRNIIKK